MSTMDDMMDGWKTVVSTSHHAGARLSRAQVEEYERQTLREWRSSKEDWSGLGKHISVGEHPETKSRIHQRFKLIGDLGSTQISDVKKVHYTYHGKKPPICLARKRIKPRRNRPIDVLRDEAEAMEKLDHDHIIKLVGSYSILRNELYLLVWPVAVCDLAKFLDDVDKLRHGQEDREDIFQHFEALDLRTEDGSTGSPGTSDHITLLHQIMGCITQATAYCHSRSIRHLDLKSTNILLGPGRVYLADFGIAKDVENRDSTRTVGRIGTPKWQAPEVIGWSSDKDEWSMRAADVYSLGLVLLNIAAVLYKGDLTEWDRILGDMDPESRAEDLEKYQMTLEPLALASQGVRPPSDPTVGPRHILELTARMTSPNPKDRPSAASVDKELVELGGLGQIYHSPCCRKSTRYLTELIDTRQKETHTKCQALQEENQRIATRIKALEGQDETFHQRLDSEKKKHVKDVENLERLLEGERQQRKRLEAQLAEVQRYGSRRTGATKSEIPSMTGSNMRYNGRTQTHDPAVARRAPNVPPTGIPTAPRSMLPSPAAHPAPSALVRPAPSPARPAPSAVQQSQDPHTRPGVSFAGAAGAGVTPREDPSTSPKPGLMSRRTNSNSKLPLAVNPATPIRSRTHTPNLNRDLSLTDSTHDSMTSSILSQLSIKTQETSAVPSPAVDAPATSPSTRSNLAAVASNSRVTIPGTGLGINGYHFGDGETQQVGGAGDVRYALGAGALSPVMSTTSAMSSPRTAKTELGSEHSFGPARRVPGLPTAPSWAEIARNDQKLRA